MQYGVRRRAGHVGPLVMCRKCLDVIQSRDVRDFVRCNCEAIAIDGGDSYTRCIGHPEDFIWDFEEQK
jgi:hypothetical protein